MDVNNPAPINSAALNGALGAIKHTTTVSLGDWSGGSTTPYIPFKTAVLNLSNYNHIYSINIRKRTSGYVDRWAATLVGTTTDSEKKYLIGAYAASTYVNSFTNAVVYIDFIAD